MKAEFEITLRDRLDKAITLVLRPDQFEAEMRHLQEFDRFEAMGVAKYFKPETKRQLRNQHIQMQLARQLMKAELN